MKPTLLLKFTGGLGGRVVKIVRGLSAREVGGLSGRVVKVV